MIALLSLAPDLLRHLLIPRIEAQLLGISSRFQIVQYLPGHGLKRFQRLIPQS